MILREAFRDQCLALGRSFSSKRQVLEEITDLVCSIPQMRELGRERILEAFLAREETGSTGFQRGVAIPHCFIPGVESFVVGLITVPQGVDFDSMDGLPARAIAFIVGPPDRRTDHIHILAGISRILGAEEILNRLVSLTDPKAALDIITSGVSKAEPGAALSPDRSILRIFIQEADHFRDILGLLSSMDSCSFVISDASATNAFIMRMPVFAAFGATPESSYIKIFTVAVPKGLANEVIRRVDTLGGGLGDQHSGVLVTVEQPWICLGSLEI